MGKPSDPKTYLLGGAVVVLLAVVAVLVIRVEGDRTRETIREVAQETRVEIEQAAKEGVEEATDAAKEGARDAVREGVKEAGKVVRELPGDVLEDILDIVRGDSSGRAEDDIANSDTVVEGGDTTKKAGDTADESAPAEEATPDQPKSEKKENRLKPQNLVTEIFKLGREVAKAADDIAQETLGLTIEDEKEVGEKFHQLLLKQHKTLDAPAEQTRIADLAAPLLETRTRKEIEYTFTIVDGPEVNAFALPGGYVYVHQGLLEFAKSDAELQFVLGHEIGHVDLKHCIRKFTYAVRAGEFAGMPAEQAVTAIYHLYELQFNEDSEFASDEYSFLRLLDLGRTRDEALSFHRRLTEHLKGLGVETAEREPTSVPDAISLEFDNHFRSHPPNEERTKKLEVIEKP